MFLNGTTYFEVLYLHSSAMFSAREIPKVKHLIHQAAAIDMEITCPPQTLR
jgi:hypothetical protein